MRRQSGKYFPEEKALANFASARCNLPHVLFGGYLTGVIVVGEHGGVLVHGFARTLVCASFLFSVASVAGPRVNGEITGLAFSYKFNSTLNSDTLDIDGVLLQGSGGSINPPAESIVLSVDGGRFIQALPVGSMVPISGGWRYLAPTGSSGITLLRVMSNGDLTIDVRKIDLTGSKPQEWGPVVLTIGDDTFTAVPNSVPVAKIVGPADAAAGTTVLLDGSQSSDFNSPSGSLSHSWSVVSEPLGSNISLTSPTSPGVSFVPLKNGAYTLRLQNSDGIADGIPALFTVNVTGAQEDPPAPPGPSNGVITLSVNQPSFFENEQAVLTLTEDAQPGNGTTRWYFRSFLNGNPITFTPVPNTHDNTFTTAPLAVGDYTLLVESYIENINAAKGLAKLVESLTADNLAIDAALLHETNPAIIAELQARKSFNLAEIANAQEQLERNRTKVGESAALSFSVTAQP